MTEAEAIRVVLRTVAALLVMVGVYLAIVGAAVTWRIYLRRRER